MNNWIGKHSYWLVPLLDILTAVGLVFLPILEFWPKSSVSYSFFTLLIYLILTVNFFIKKKYSFIKIEYKNILKDLSIHKNILNLILKYNQDNIGKVLKTTSDNLGFNKTKEKEDRITLFGIRNNSFFILARWSENPMYRNINQTKTYDINSGCIAKAYQNGWLYEKGTIPDFNKNPNGYIEYFKTNYSIKEQKIRKLSMKSRYYAAIKICDIHKEYGILVVESKCPERFSESIIKIALESGSKELCYLLEVLELRTKNLSDSLESEIEKI